METLSPPPGFVVPVLHQTSPQMSLEHSPQASQQLSPNATQQLSPKSPHQLYQQTSQQPQLDKTKRSKERRISWATGDKLCQIRLFAAEDAPLLSGSVQDQLQAKQVRNFHIINSSSSVLADAPPGFGGVAVKSKSDPAALAAIVPQISWRAPSGVKLDPAWLVVAGGASKEIVIQNQREVRVLEAVYPRPSSIPDSPAEPLEAQEPYDDSITPQIPLVPLEEEDLQDGSDMSRLSLGPPLLLQGPSRQVAGGQIVSPKVPAMANGRLEEGKPYSGNGLTLPIRDEILNGSRHPVWRPGPLPANPNHSGVEPDVTAAAAVAAALAAQIKSSELGSMIDNELLIQILNDPSLIQSLTPRPNIENLKSDLFSMIVSTVLSLPEKTNAQHPMNLVRTGGGNQWINPSSAVKLGSAVGQDGSRSRIGEAYSNGSEGFQRPTGSNEMSLVPVSAGNGHLYTESLNGRVGSAVVARPSNSSGGPPGFGNGNNSGNVQVPPGFGNNCASQQTSQTITSQLATVPGRALSPLDEQYFKSLIMHHGCKSANDDDHGLAGMDSQGSSGSRTNIAQGLAEVKRWYGRDDIEATRSERNTRDRRDNERNVIGPATESRGKSRKACMYFGTSRGCRNGASCAFVHDSSEPERPPRGDRSGRLRNEPTHLQYIKRLRVDG